MKSLLFWFYFIPINIFAQQNCDGVGANKLFQANQIGATFSPQGIKFPGEQPFIKYPYTSESSPTTLFASSPWIGGMVNGELRVAAQTYGYSSGWDFYTGPLLENAETLGDECYRFNKIWEVSREEISKHLDDFLTDGIISDTISNVFNWPGEGNIYFSVYNGFDLPTNHRGGWADFSDNNSNGIFEPHMGEYPCVFQNGIKRIPEKMMWMVFNDQGPHTASGGLPLGVEFQLTVFAFNCLDNVILNNTIFTTYKIINQNSFAIDSVFFGMWTDTDLGCSEDDFEGCDTIRHTEYVYNADNVDGDAGTECSTGSSTYGYSPPMQSHTYLSHRLSSYIAAPIHALTSPYPYSHVSEFKPEECYGLLNGFWRDGTPITAFGNGYNPGAPFPATKYLFSGDPRDPLQWSLQSEGILFNDACNVSSVFLDTLESYNPIKVETAYIFHHDSMLNHIAHVGLMKDQIDSLFRLITNPMLPCTHFPFCEENDCVWPGDFNHNGIADHYDLLYWGVMKDQTGPARDGKIYWDGHFANSWVLNLPDLLNAKHGDGNGNAVINDEDLDRNIHHFLYTNPLYVADDKYPEGPEVQITSHPMDEEGRIRNIQIRAGVDMENVLGLAYELDFDTSFLKLQAFRYIHCPSDTNILCLFDDAYNPGSMHPHLSHRYGFVKTDHEELTLEAGHLFERAFNGLIPKAGVPYESIPDTLVIRLKNLIALDAEGNDLHIGSTPLVIVKPEIVGNTEILESKYGAYPNPCQDEVLIYSEINSDVDVFNIHGSKLRTISYHDTHMPVNVSDLVPGVYFLRFMKTGHLVKLIIQ